jgi:hypothetical protein
MPKNQHVLPHPGGWAVTGAGNARATKLFDKQSDAIERARHISQRQQSELLVHGRHGQLRARDSYGRDSCPPKDKK